jgi:phosphopentomutase
MVYGHRRDIEGYARALEQWDARLPEFEKLLKPGDVAIITADHGCDPTYKGTDHTREYIPILVFGPEIQPGSIGRRETFADIGQSLAVHFGLAPFEHGKSFL